MGCFYSRVASYTPDLCEPIVWKVITPYDYLSDVALKSIEYPRRFRNYRLSKWQEIY